MAEICKIDPAHPELQRKMAIEDRRILDEEEFPDQLAHDMAEPDPGAEADREGPFVADRLEGRLLAAPPVLESVTVPGFEVQLSLNLKSFVRRFHPAETVRGPAR